MIGIETPLEITTNLGTTAIDMVEVEKKSWIGTQAKTGTEIVIDIMIDTDKDLQLLNRLEVGEANLENLDLDVAPRGIAQNGADHGTRHREGGADLEILGEEGADLDRLIVRDRLRGTVDQGDN